ncbi:neuronal acetylcholine receptor subunit beta-2-like [Ruditapes philippinarum]|uniref:neuronal acetylcholine receptor subunit beta-2-like n=1 Tax=Ruditapes philippinarum TaxID=129788 RepID=UPI00295BE6E1|nr:neuronal acetylcholine receptor subunit beta-2-like [Ruditapes philippinarum]XP_060571965.1 neuronal acetylcholine receptor subunit beta-2-like [Ruditapes philippinarum]XP_060571967.1 neuronal acetylcholine receptor subunit beta-2-like [Ruditapes philippinarum]
MEMDDSNLRFFIISFLIVSVNIFQCSSSIPSYSKELETAVRTELFTDYEVLQRPDERTFVSIGLNLVTINSLDIKDQILSTSGFFTMKWDDSRLDWSGNVNYTSIRFLFTTEKYAWRPAIFIENSVTELEVFSNTNWLIRLSSDGSAYWTPGGIFETSCDVDITYYPLDTQTCSIVLTTWAYTTNEVYLMFSDDPISTDDFSPNGEWDLIETSTSTETAEKSKHDTNSYTRLSFTFKLKRRPLFHILNTIFPVLLMASLIIFVFKLPPESGERVGMSLTVLLAYAVYLTLIADNIPRTSLSTSILSTYLTIIFMLSTLSVIFTIVVLDIYFNHDDDEEPPRWVQTMTRLLLVKISMWKGERCCKKKKVSPKNKSSELSLSTVKLPLDGVEPFDSNAKTRYRGKNSDVVEVNHLEGDDDADEDEIKIYSWKEVALILDRCFMYLFILLVIVTSIVCLGILASK